MKKISVVILSIVCFSSLVYAIPARGIFDTFEQPNGAKLNAKVCGDERVHWFETADGYTLLRNKDGFFVYAEKDIDGNLKESKYVAGRDDKKLPQSIIPHLRYSKQQIDAKFADWKINDTPPQKITNSLQAVEGVRKYLIVLMEYPDVPFTKTREEYDAMFNQKNYQGAGGIGSVLDYYQENSYGLFAPQFVVVGPYMAEHNQAYYTTETGSHAAVRELVKEATDYAIDELGSFNSFDNDADDIIDAVGIIFAGHGAESGDNNAIWSHKGYTASYFYEAPMYGGKYVWIYCCFPELEGKYGTSISKIGVLCHEFCHTLGAPDYYDTDYSEQGQYTGAGNWCLMAGGSWNGGGRCPAGINIFQKWQYGWVEPIILAENDANVVIQNSAHFQEAYIIETRTEGEFYMMENRQQIGFDANIPGHGLLIWHVTTGAQGAACVNCKHPNLMYPVSANSSFRIPTSDPTSYGVINSSSTPFPGTLKQTEFTDKTTPAAIAWNGNSNYKPIKNITETDSVISFNYTGRPDIIFNVPYTYNFTDANYFNYYNTICPEIGYMRWQREYETSSQNWCCHLQTYTFEDKSPTHHWLIFPLLYLDSGFTYNFSFLARVRREDKPGNIQLLLGNSQSIDEQKITLTEKRTIENTTFEKIEKSVQINENGVYSFAFLTIGEGEAMDLYLDNFSITGMVGVSEQQTPLNQFTLYPNPAKDNITLKFDAPLFNTAIIDIIGYDGRSLMHINTGYTEQQEIIISLTPLALTDGSYLVRVVSGNNQYIQPLIINR